MRWNLGLLYAALAAYLLSALLTIAALRQGSRLLAGIAIAGMVAAIVLFLLAIWNPRRKVDWDRIQAEQRLWESGPLGRSWLRVRQRLSDLWKI